MDPGVAIFLHRNTRRRHATGEVRRAAAADGRIGSGHVTGRDVDVLTSVLHLCEGDAVHTSAAAIGWFITKRRGICLSFSFVIA